MIVGDLEGPVQKPPATEKDRQTELRCATLLGILHFLRIYVFFFVLFVSFLRHYMIEPF